MKKKFLVVNILDFSTASVHQINIDAEFAKHYYGISDIDGVDTKEIVSMALKFYGFRESDINYMVSIKELDSNDEIVETNLIACSLEEYIQMKRREILKDYLKCSLS